MLRGAILCLCAQAVDFISKQQPLSQPHQEVTVKEVVKYVGSIGCSEEEVANNPNGNPRRLASALNGFTTSEEVMESVKSFQKQLQRARDAESGASILTRLIHFFRSPKAFPTGTDCDTHISHCSLQGAVDFVVGIKTSLTQNRGVEMDLKGDATELEDLGPFLVAYTAGMKEIMQYLSTQSVADKNKMDEQRKPLESFASAITVIADLKDDYCNED